MSHNSFGHLFRVTTWGESHGPAIGCVVDGCPPRIPLTAEEIQADLDRRRPGTSRFTTQRREPDEVKILSGVMIDDDGVQVYEGDAKLDGKKYEFKINAQTGEIIKWKLDD